MKIEIRPEIGIPMCNCAVGKMEAIGCLVPKLQSEMHSGCATQLFEKAQCFYVATVNFIVSVYYCVHKFTCVLVKMQLASQQRHLGKTVVVQVGAFIAIDRKTTDMDLKQVKSQFFKHLYKLFIATLFRISLSCL